MNRPFPETHSEHTQFIGASSNLKRMNPFALVFALILLPTVAMASDATENFAWPFGLYSKEDSVMRHIAPEWQYAHQVVVGLTEQDAGLVAVDPAYWTTLAKSIERKTGFLIEPQYFLVETYWVARIRGVHTNAARDQAIQSILNTGTLASLEADPLIFTK